MKVTLKAGLILLSATMLFCSCNDNANTPESSPVTDSVTTAAVIDSPVTEAPLTEIDAGLKSSNDYMTNPYSSITKIGDPFILADEGKYYMYATSAGIGFKCWVSDSLTSWNEAGLAYERSEDTFGIRNFWAPEVYKYNGTYYMVFSAIDENKVYHIGIASSASPTGPFKDCLGGKPLYSTGYSIIDASLFFDDDGRIYMYYSRDCSENVVDGYHTSQSYGIEVASDLMSVIGEPVLLTTPDAEWELKTKKSKYIWNEGPCVLKHNGTYYLMYSANGYATNGYSVGYATSDSPLGKYTKSETNPIIQGDGVKLSGTGHNNYFYSPDGTEVYTVYHAHTDPKNPSGNRTPCIDKLVFGDDGELYCFGPTAGRVPLPSGEKGYYKLYEGVTVSASNGADASCLMDERLAKDEDGCISLKAEECVTVTIKDPRELYLLWIYNGSETATLPNRIRVEINGEYVIDDLRTQSSPNAANVISLTNLPEGTKVDTIKIFLTPQDGKDASSICEILLQYISE